MKNGSPEEMSSYSALTLTDTSRMDRLLEGQQWLSGSGYAIKDG